jgi:hypothetical protein
MGPKRRDTSFGLRNVFFFFFFFRFTNFICILDLFTHYGGHDGEEGGNGEDSDEVTGPIRRVARYWPRYVFLFSLFILLTLYTSTTRRSMYYV